MIHLCMVWSDLTSAGYVYHLVERKPKKHSHKEGSEVHISIDLWSLCLSTVLQTGHQREKKALTFGVILWAGGNRTPGFTPKKPSHLLHSYH